MRARRKIVVSLLTFAGLVALAVGGLFLMFPGSHINRIKQDSPLYLPATQLNDHNIWEQRIRHSVLQQLPIGSPRDRIQAFLQKHFVHVQYRVTSSDDSRALTHVTEPHVFIRAIDDSHLYGQCQVEIYLILTADERLKNVIVKGVYGYV
jgi:hypothetical protein